MLIYPRQIFRTLTVDLDQNRFCFDRGAFAKPALLARDTARRIGAYNLAGERFQVRRYAKRSPALRMGLLRAFNVLCTGHEVSSVSGE